ncbi:MAG: hypothetical protein K6C05_08245 [Anaerovibrio sp.]|uniref:hypothetical protein n=1 Tax=Anaerovibrio sp. TaxID=1872532 RepID=UPI0025FE01F5|nr:hypothetical protein [Anaerovibrio sp.]MCR5176826.1 hypothetical protein [Anaerovibrio sp.]
MTITQITTEHAKKLDRYVLSCTIKNADAFVLGNCDSPEITVVAIYKDGSISIIQNQLLGGIDSITSEIVFEDGNITNVLKALDCLSHPQPCENESFPA